MPTGLFNSPYYLVLALLVATMPVNVIAQKNYEPSKVVYDVTAKTTKEINHLLDRAALLQKTYNNDSFSSEIIFVIHEDAIPHFTKAASSQLQQRAQSLTLGEVINFRVCAASAKMQGFKPTDFPSFIKVIPMADAEIIQLQNIGYAYLR